MIPGGKCRACGAQLPNEYEMTVGHFGVGPREGDPHLHTDSSHMQNLEKNEKIEEISKFWNVRGLFG